MPLSAYALVTLSEAKDHLGTPGGGKDAYIESAINRASDLIESYLDRQIVTRGSLVEYHTMQADGAALFTEKLWTLQFPIIAVASVNEDSAWPRTYGASSLLVEGTDYEVAKAKGLIRRLSSTGTWLWASSPGGGSRAIRVTYTAGYAAAAVPERIKTVALRLIANMWGENERKAFGLLSQSDSQGNFTRFGPTTLSKDMQDDLYTERRQGMCETGEAA